jgi:hypothetical protein
LSSFPFTPVESLKFLHYLYDEKKAEYSGPYDAFHLIIIGPPRYLAIDQGTIVPMIENYHTGLLWKLFMNAQK